MNSETSHTIIDLPDECIAACTRGDARLQFATYWRRKLEFQPPRWAACAYLAKHGASASALDAMDNGEIWDRALMLICLSLARGESPVTVSG